MGAKLVAWDRLVRYVAQGESQIRYGEPILTDLEENAVAYLADVGQLTVRVCEGDGPLTAVPTDKIETVERLLGPLQVKDVPIIRCIGLNYKTHSKPSLMRLRNMFARRIC